MRLRTDLLLESILLFREEIVCLDELRPDFCGDEEVYSGRHINNEAEIDSHTSFFCLECFESL